MKLDVQITMCRMQLDITFLLGIFLNFNIFIFILCYWVIGGGSEGSRSSTSGKTTLNLKELSNFINQFE